MPVIAYPASLPVPSVAPLTPTERRYLTPLPGSRQQRVRERDFNAQQRVEWAVLSRAELAVFRAWWHDELIEGGAWFAAAWPVPEGRVTRVRKFLAEPERVYLGNGRWRVSGACEVQGRSELPESPAVVAAAIGWLEPVDTTSGTAAHANAGTRGYRFEYSLHAGVVAYAGQSVAWSIASWTPTAGAASPTLSDLGSGLVRVNWSGGSGGAVGAGLLVLTATIDGAPVAVGQRLEASAAPISYAAQSWGPEP